MKKTIFCLALLLAFSAVQANLGWMQLNLYKGVGVANPAGNTYNITYLEVEGTGNTGCLEMYFSVDINEFLGATDVVRESVQPGSYQILLNPRFSLDKFLLTDLQLGLVQEWYITGLYQGRADQQFSGDNYSIGLGTDIQIPYIEKFSFNFYKMFEHVNQQKNNNWKVSFEDAGWLAEIIWDTQLKEIGEDFTLSYRGKATYGFANNWAEENYLGPDDTGTYVLSGTSTEWLMFNGLFWNAKKWSISTSVKLQDHCLYRDSKNHDALSFWFGLHRKF